MCYSHLWIFCGIDFAWNRVETGQCRKHRNPVFSSYSRNCGSCCLFYSFHYRFSCKTSSSVADIHYQSLIRNYINRVGRDIYLVFLFPGVEEGESSPCDSKEGLATSQHMGHSIRHYAPTKSNALPHLTTYPHFQPTYIGKLPHEGGTLLNASKKFFRKMENFFSIRKCIKQKSRKVHIAI